MKLVRRINFASDFEYATEHLRLCELLRTYSVITFMAVIIASVTSGTEADFSVNIRQITSGPNHHFFGYIGHAQNIPWNGDGRYIVSLRTSFQNRMPKPGEPADVVLIDTRNGNRILKIDESRAWNFQQGTMFYWNPSAPERELIFNDRDPVTHKVFTVVYDIVARKRVREFRFDDTPFGNSGVAQRGGYFLGLNYGRMARLRPVTGYPGAFDWNSVEAAPADDGVYIVEMATGTKRLLVSFANLARAADTKGRDLFINHTLWSRDDSRIYFYVRGDFGSRERRVDIPMSIKPDGTGLTQHRHLGGHPEWLDGTHIIGSTGGRMLIYDVDAKEVVETLGGPKRFPKSAVTWRFRQIASGLWSVTEWRRRISMSSTVVPTKRACRRVGFHILASPREICEWTVRPVGTAPAMRSCSPRSLWMARASFFWAQFRRKTR